MSEVVSIVSKDEENRMSDVTKTVGRILAWFVFIGFLHITLTALFGAFFVDFSKCSALNGKCESYAEKSSMTALVTQPTINHDEREGFNSSYIMIVTIITSLGMTLYGLLCVIGIEESPPDGSNGFLAFARFTAFTSQLFLMDTQDSSDIFFHGLYAQIALCAYVAHIRLIILEHLERANVVVLEMKNVKP